MSEKIDIKKYNSNRIHNLTNDIRNLIDRCENELENKNDLSVSYVYFVKDYNNILSELQDCGCFENKKLISLTINCGDLMPLLPHHRTKVIEVVTESKKLESRIQTTLKPELHKKDSLEVIKLICSRFNLVTRQLRDRYGNRDTLDVKNEYDVQDLLHAILKLFFNDIRPEEPTVSYASGYRKMDFLLNSESIVIETKMTRDNLSNKELVSQLHDDIATYKIHPNCNILVIFIYDPSGRIGNPAGFKKDIETQSTDEFTVINHIYPLN